MSSHAVCVCSRICSQAPPPYIHLVTCSVCMSIEVWRAATLSTRHGIYSTRLFNYARMHVHRTYNRTLLVVSGDVCMSRSFATEEDHHMVGKTFDNNNLWLVEQLNFWRYTPKSSFIHVRDCNTIGNFQPIDCQLGRCLYSWHSGMSLHVRVSCKYWGGQWPVGH